MTARPAPVLSESLEDYLEAIYHLEREARVARAGAIASRLGVSRPSVTGALRLLAERRLIHYVPYAGVTLTAEGRRAAAAVARRHGILKAFLERVLSLPADDAERAACRMEHVLEAPVMSRFLEFARFIEACPRRSADWVRGVGFACRDRGAAPECDRCPNVAPPGRA